MHQSPKAGDTEHGRRPEPRPDVDRRENPDGIPLAPCDRADLVSLEFCCFELRDRLGIELSTTRCRSLKPAINRVPRDSLHPRYGRLAHALNAQGRDLVEGRATMLETIVGRAACRAERGSAAVATVSTTLSRLRFVKAVADNIAGTHFSPRPPQHRIVQFNIY